MGEGVLLDFLAQEQVRDAAATHDTKARVHRNMGSKPNVKTKAQREAEAKKFRKENPKVWDAFVKLTKEAVEAQHREKFSVEMVFNVLRWNTMMRGEDGSGFKINNNYKSYFARWFMEEFPEHGEVFETREAA